MTKYLLLLFSLAFAVEAAIDNDPSIHLKELEECQNQFTDSLPSCNPCFEASCKKCASSAQAKCQETSRAVFMNETCQVALQEQIDQFVKKVSKCAPLLQTPRPSKTRMLVSANRTDWMSHVPDSQTLAHMTIPGTHQSCARYGGILAECQTMTIMEQLNNGIRFLDIRARVFENGFTMHHEMVYQNMVFGGVLDQCFEFLDKHPTETILIKMKQEYSRASDAEYIKIFNSYRTERGYKGRPYGEKMHIDYSVPTLGQVRGKMVIISQVAGLPGIQWPTVDTQDDYWVSTIAHISDKWQKVKNHLTKAAEEHAQGYRNMHANFASGASYGIGLAFPHIIAKSVNRDLYSHLQSQKCSHGDTCYYGIVAMDYPGYYDNGVIDELIKQNKKK